MALNLKKLSKDQLLNLNEELVQKEEEIKFMRDELKVEVEARMKHEQEIWGSYAVSKQKRYSFPDVTVDQAKELSATKEVKDDLKLKKIYLAGGKVQAKVTQYIMIRNIDQEKTEE